MSGSANKDEFLFDDGDFAAAGESAWESTGPSSLQADQQTFNHFGVDAVPMNDFAAPDPTPVPTPAPEIYNMSETFDTPAFEQPDYAPDQLSYAPPVFDASDAHNDAPKTTDVAVSGASSRAASVADVFGEALKTHSSGSSAEYVAPSAALKEWERMHEEELEKKRVGEDALKEKRCKEAQKQLSEWYKTRETKLAKTREANRTAQKKEAGENSTDAPANPQQSWGRVCQLIELTADGPANIAKLNMKPKPAASKPGTGSPAPKDQPTPVFQKDISRMQNLLLQLKSNASPLYNGVH